MRTILTRLADLEATVGEASPRRVYALSGGPSGENPADFVRSCGLPLDERDLIIHRVLVSPSPTGPVKVGGPWQWTGRPPAGVSP